MEEMMMKGGVKCRVINWNNVKGKGKGRRGEERRGEGGVSKYYKHK